MDIPPNLAQAAVTIMITEDRLKGSENESETGNTLGKTSDDYSPAQKPSTCEDSG